jgi:hypothetical protein
LAVAPVTQLCSGCHDQRQAKFAAAHLQLDMSASECTKCHNPHSGKDARQLNAVAHGPFEQRKCAICHTAASGGAK